MVITITPIINDISVTAENKIIQITPDVTEIKIYTSGLYQSGSGGSGTGDVIAPATNSADYIPQWDGSNSKKLKNGLPVPDGGLAGLTALGLKVDKVAGKGLSENDYTTAEKNKLNGIASGAEVNVNADWNATSGDAQILNKPPIPAAQIQSDWNQSSSSALDYIKNKPTIPTKTSDLTNDSNFVADASYVHTDNNYTTTDKQTLADNKLLIDLKTDASKGLFFYDNFLYVKPQLAVGQVGLSYYTLNSQARSQIAIIETGYGKKRALDLNTYTYATCDAMVNAILSVIPNYGVLTFETRIKIPVLSVAAQRFVCYNGMQDGVSSSPTDYIRFEYSDTINSGKFLCSCCVGGVTSTADSLITAVADTWYILKIVTNSNASSIGFYIDETLVSTITTNIPTTVDMNTVNRIIKSVGTTQSDLYVDYVKCFQIYN
jgi:hypothetical protein